jgi:hypothetical protein
MHDIISHMTFDTYQEFAPDDYSVAILFLLLLSSEIGRIRILHVHPISTIRKPWESTTVCVKE